MTAAFEFGIYKVVNKIKRKAGSHNSSAETKNVSVIMIPCKSCTEGIRAARRSYTLYFIRSHGHTYSGSANKYSEICLTVRYLFAKFFCDNGIVNRLRRKATDIKYFFSFILKVLYYDVLEFESTVITAYYKHFNSPF